MVDIATKAIDLSHKMCILALERYGIALALTTFRFCCVLNENAYQIKWFDIVILLYLLKVICYWRVG